MKTLAAAALTASLFACGVEDHGLKPYQTDPAPTAATTPAPLQPGTAAYDHIVKQCGPDIDLEFYGAQGCTACHDPHTGTLTRVNCMRRR